MGALSRYRLGLLSALLCAVAVEAWWAPGHLTIGEIAAQTLEENGVQDFEANGQRVLMLTMSILKSFSLFFPVETVGLSESSIWMDDIKSGNQAFSHWHYVDLAVEDNKTIPLSQVSPLDVTQIHNATWALVDTHASLTNFDANAWDQSFFLMVLTHILGDIHQPLHCSTRFTAKYPSGDRGGNRVSIKFSQDAEKALSSSSSIHNLHSLWDNAVGALDDVHQIYPVPQGTTGVKQANVKAAATTLRQLYPLSTFTSDDTFFNFSSGNIEDLINGWAAESNALAVEYVYKSADGEILVDDDSHASIDKDYVLRGQNVSEMQLAKAGYRLAYLLSHIYSVNTAPPTLTCPACSGGSSNKAAIGVLATLVCLLVLLSAFLAFQLKRSHRKTDQLHRLRSSVPKNKLVEEHLGT